MKHNDKDVIVINSNGLKIGLLKKEWNKAIKENQELIIKFDAHSKNLNLSDTTRICNFKTILRFAKVLKKSFKDVTKEDINNYFLKVKGKDTCKVNYMFTLKKYLLSVKNLMRIYGIKRLLFN